MKRPDLLVRQTTSILIAKFPSSPTTRQRRAMRAYLLLMNKLFGVGRDPNTKSRNRLTDWAEPHFELWRNADFAATSPSLWGPLFWRLMLRCARMYKRKRRAKYSAWLDSLIYLLPCKDCAKHYRRMLESSISKWERVRSADDLVQYISWMQSTVRRRVQGEEKKLSPATFKTKSTWSVRDVSSVTARRPPTRRDGRRRIPARLNTTANMVTRTTNMNINTNASIVANMITSARNRNGSRLGGWYGATSGAAGASFIRGYR